MANRIDQKDAIAFMKGGKARFVLHTLKSDRQFRYRFKLRPDSEVPENSAWWIYIEPVGIPGSWPAFIYLGYIKGTDLYIRDDPQWPKELKQGVELLTYCWRNLKTQTVSDQLHILHLGFCSVCGRPLKDAHSLEIGIGPECFKRIS